MCIYIYICVCLATDIAIDIAVAIAISGAYRLTLCLRHRSLEPSMSSTRRPILANTDINIDNTNFFFQKAMSNFENVLQEAVSGAWGDQYIYI